MKKNLKAALYDPYLDILGGGEKHILSIFKVLDDEGYGINIFWDRDLTREIKNRFSFQSFTELNFLPNIFQKSTSLFKKLLILKDFDLFFYITDGSYFFSTAKKNFVFCMAPQKDLYRMTLLNRLKTVNYQFISNSIFTQKWLKKWGIDSQVIYPYLDKELIDLEIKNIKKDKIILSVGRFYQHLHAKNQDIIINLFKKIKQKYSLFKDFKLILAGGLKKEDKDYLVKLKNLVNDNPSIQLLSNISYKQLLHLYQKSMIYWHFTGYGVDENKHPEMVEHLGISPLEAMAAGCLTFCYNAGGSKEIIKNGENGFLFSSKDELINKTLSVMNDFNRQKKIVTNAQKYIKEKFSYKTFQTRVKKIIL